MTVESTATSGHILVIDSLSEAEYAAVTKKYLTDLCEAGRVKYAHQLLTDGIVRLEDKEEYQSVREPFAELNSEEQLAVRVAAATAKLVGAIAFPYAMLDYGTQYGLRPKLLYEKLRHEQHRLGLQPVIAYAVHADGRIW